MGLDGIDVVFKLATLDELDDVSNLNQSFWFWLLPQSAFCPCYLGCSPIDLLGEFFRGWGQPSSTSLHCCGCIASCLDILHYYLTSRRFTKVTISSSTWYDIKGGPCFYFNAWWMRLVRRVAVWKIASKTDLVQWY